MKSVHNFFILYDLLYMLQIIISNIHSIVNQNELYFIKKYKIKEKKSNVTFNNNYRCTNI